MTFGGGGPCASGHADGDAGNGTAYRSQGCADALRVHAVVTPVILGMHVEGVGAGRDSIRCRLRQLCRRHRHTCSPVRGVRTVETSLKHRHPRTVPL